MKKWALQLGIVLASSLNYAGVALLNLIWTWEFHLLLPILTITSFLMGMTVVNMKRAIVYATISIFFGSTLVTAIMSAPPMLLSESPAKVDAAIVAGLSRVSYLLIINVVVCIFGVAMGSLVGEWLEPIEEFEI